MKKCKRIFVIVIDSLGIGEMPDADKFGDVGTNTLGHIPESVDSFEIPNLQKLGIANLTPLKRWKSRRDIMEFYGRKAMAKIP